MYGLGNFLYRKNIKIIKKGKIGKNGVNSIFNKPEVDMKISIFINNQKYEGEQNDRETAKGGIEDLKKLKEAKIKITKI